jgi:hypothetical protein
MDRRRGSGGRVLPCKCEASVQTLVTHTRTCTRAHTHTRMYPQDVNATAWPFGTEVKNYCQVRLKFQNTPTRRMGQSWGQGFKKIDKSPKGEGWADFLLMGPSWKNNELSSTFLCFTPCESNVLPRNSYLKSQPTAPFLSRSFWIHRSQVPSATCMEGTSVRLQSRVLLSLRICSLTGS